MLTLPSPTSPGPCFLLGLNSGPSFTPVSCFPPELCKPSPQSHLHLCAHIHSAGQALEKTWPSRKGSSGGWGSPAQVGPSQVPLLSAQPTELTPHSTGCLATATFPPSHFQGKTDHTDVRSLNMPELNHMSPHTVLVTLSSPPSATQSSVFYSN